MDLMNFHHLSRLWMSSDVSTSEDVPDSVLYAVEQRSAKRPHPCDLLKSGLSKLHPGPWGSWQQLFAAVLTIWRMVLLQESWGNSPFSWKKKVEKNTHLGTFFAMEISESRGGPHLCINSPLRGRKATERSKWDDVDLHVSSCFPVALFLSNCVLKTTG